jgi:hypothetical protein
LASAPKGHRWLGRTAAASTGPPPDGSFDGSQRTPESTSTSHLIHCGTPRSPPRSPPLDAGSSLRDVQDFARHADPRQTRRYDRARGALDRNPTYIVDTHLVGATGAR